MIYGFLLGVICVLVDCTFGPLTPSEVVWIIYMVFFFISLFISYDIAAFFLVLTIYAMAPPLVQLRRTTYIEIPQETDDKNTEIDEKENLSARLESFKPTYNKNMLV